MLHAEVLHVEDAELQGISLRSGSDLAPPPEPAPAPFIPSLARKLSGVVGKLPLRSLPLAIALLVTSAGTLARSLGISTIAEGVKSEPQRRFLRQQGCDQLQGFLLGHPMPAQAIATFVRSHTAPR